jgi:hypothetical protein
MKSFKSFFIVLLIVLFSPQVLAVGLRGTSTNIHEMFQPNLEYPFYYDLVTDTRWANGYEVYADSELAKYVVFEKNRFENVPPGTAIPISGKIKLPAELNHSGWNVVFICGREDCPGGGTMCGRAAVCAAIQFMVLYPGINPIVGLSAPNVNRDQPVDFSVSVENLGKEGISSATGRIDVFNINKEKVGDAGIEAKPVKSAAKENLNARFETAGLLPGNYSATAYVDADGEKREANASFRIGTLEIKVLSHTKELATGGIKRFVTKVESVWNDPLDVFANVQISDSNNSVASKTSTNRLKPWQTLDLEAFIDTSKLEEKEYDVRIELFYAEKKTVFEGKVKLIAPPAAAVNATVPKLEEPKKEGISATALTIILVIVVIILTAVNIFLALYRKKKD